MKTDMIEKIDRLHYAIQALCPTKSLLSIDNIIRPPLKTSTPKQAVNSVPATRPMVPTAAALKMGVGFPLKNLPGTNDDTNRILSTQCQNKTDLLYDCGICKRVNDQHLLAKCDTCHLHYHLGCLNPPLLRHPKKSKIYGWQCSECDEDNPDVQLTSGPRKSRTKFNSKDGTIVPVDSSRDVSLDGSADDEKMPSVKSQSSAKSPPPIQMKKINNKKCDKDDKIQHNEIKLNANANEKIIAKNEKILPIDVQQSNELSTETSPIPFNSVKDKDSKLDNSKSPKKRKLSKKSNLDKVIDAVSRGIIDKSDEPIPDKKSSAKIKLLASKPINSIETAGSILEDLKETKTSIKSPKSPKSPMKSPKSKSPIKSPIRSPISSPIRSLIKSPIRSPIRTPIRSPIRSPVLSMTSDKSSTEIKKLKPNKKAKKEKDRAKDKTKIKEKRKRKTIAATMANDNISKDIKIDELSVIGMNEPKTIPNASSEEIIKINEPPTDIADKTKTNEIKPSNVENVQMENNSEKQNIVNGLNETESTTNTNAEITHKQSRKRRKEKHRNKHGTDSERSSSKEHKKKRKRKNHDLENPESFSMADGVPKIKIKVQRRTISQ